MSTRRPSVSVYYRKREQYWTVRWREHGRQYEDGGYHTENEAQAAAVTIRERLHAGLPGVRAPQRISDIIQHWWDTYVTTGSIQYATRETYKIDAKRILATIGHEDAHTSQGKIREWRDAIAKQYGARAANKAHTALSSAFERALEAHPPKAETNPCRGIKRLPETRKGYVAPTRTHIDYLERTAPSQRELAMLMIASRGGLRQSELFGLSWDQAKQITHIFVSQVADRQRVIRNSTKTKRSERRVPLPPRTQAAIRAIMPPIPTGLMFPSPTDHDRPMARSAWAKVYWKRWRRHAAWMAASLDEPADVWLPLLELDWMNLRHHAISRWAAAGASIAQVSRWSGDSIATIDKHYAYLFDEDERDVMLAVD